MIVQKLPTLTTPLWTHRPTTTPHSLMGRSLIERSSTSLSHSMVSFSTDMCHFLFRACVRVKHKLSKHKIIVFVNFFITSIIQNGISAGSLHVILTRVRGKIVIEQNRNHSNDRSFTLVIGGKEMIFY